MRRFENGVVLVNPTADDGGEVRLDREYVDPETGKAAQSVVLKAHTGKILLIHEK
jgi:hypothetical protein